MADINQATRNAILGRSNNSNRVLGRQAPSPTATNNPFYRDPVKRQEQRTQQQIASLRSQGYNVTQSNGTIIAKAQPVRFLQSAIRGNKDYSSYIPNVKTYKNGKLVSDVYNAYGGSSKNRIVYQQRVTTYNQDGSRTETRYGVVGKGSVKKQSQRTILPTGQIVGKYSRDLKSEQRAYEASQKAKAEGKTDDQLLEEYKRKYPTSSEELIKRRIATDKAKAALPKQTARQKEVAKRRAYEQSQKPIAIGRDKTGKVTVTSRGYESLKGTILSDEMAKKISSRKVPSSLIQYQKPGAYEMKIDGKVYRILDPTFEKELIKRESLKKGIKTETLKDYGALLGRNVTPEISRAISQGNITKKDIEKARNLTNLKQKEIFDKVIFDNSIPVEFTKPDGTKVTIKMDKPLFDNLQGKFIKLETEQKKVEQEEFDKKFNQKDYTNLTPGSYAMGLFDESLKNKTSLIGGNAVPKYEIEKIQGFTDIKRYIGEWVDLKSYISFSNLEAKQMAGVQKNEGKTLLEISRENAKRVNPFSSKFYDNRLNDLKYTTVVAGLGFLRGGLGFYDFFRHLPTSIKSAANSLRPKNIKTTVKGEVKRFTIDPVGTMAEWYAWGKLMNFAGKGIKKSPVGKYVREELYIRLQPKELRPYVRSILKSQKIQAKINPFKIKTIKKVNFLDVKTLNKVEAQALKKTLQQTDSVVFGSKAARVTSRGRTPLPKDVDIATSSIQRFTEVFKRNLPKSIRANYILKGEKIISKTSRQALFDIKPIERLIPQQSLLTRKGSLPVGGYIKQSAVKVRLQSINSIISKIDKIKARILITKSKTALTKLKKSLKTTQSKLKKEVSGIKLSELPKSKRQIIQGAYEVPTGKIVEIEGIRFTGFGEQTTRKALGTLQVLLEKNVKRAKDPQALLISLEIQKNALMKRLLEVSKVRKTFIKNKIKVLDNTIKLLKSKQFARILESKVKGLTKEYPLISKIDVKKLKKINPKTVNRIVKQRLERMNKRTTGRIKAEDILNNNVNSKGYVNLNDVSSYLPSSRTARRSAVSSINSMIDSGKGISKSNLPSRLPKTKPSVLPSRIPKVKVSKLPTIKRSVLPSKIPSSKLRIKKLKSSILPTLLPKIMLFPSKIPSKLPKKSVLPRRVVSKLPSKPISKMPYIKEYEKKVKKNKLRIDDDDVEKKRKIALGRLVIPRRFVYLSDLTARIRGEKLTKAGKRRALMKGRRFTGLERRKMLS